MAIIFALMASAISLIFAIVVLIQYFERKKPYQLIWSIALFMFTLAAFFEFYAGALGWPPLMYRIYYVTAASLVAYLGLGTLYLLTPRWFAHLCAVLITGTVMAMLYFALRATVDLEVLKSAVQVAGKAMPRQVRLFSPFLTVPGSFVLIGGAIYSAWIFWKRKILRDRMIANIFIAVGAFVVASGGSLARFGRSEFLYLTEMIGVAIMFYGFLRGGRT